MERRRIRSFALGLIGFLDMFAASLVGPALPVHIKSFGVSSTVTGAIRSIYGALQFFASPVIGRWSDKSGRLNVLGKCLVLTSIGYYASGFNLSSLLMLSILRVLPGIFKHTQVLCKVCITEESGSSRTQALGNFNAMASMGFIIGPSVHGHLIEYFGHDEGLFLSFFICGSIFILNTIIVYILKFYPVDSSMENEAQFNQKGDSNDDIEKENSPIDINLKNKLLKFQRGILVSKFFLGLSVMNFRSSFVLWLTHYHPELSSISVGYMISYNGFLGLFFGFMVGTISNLKFYKGFEEKLHIHACFLLSIAFSIVFISTNIPVVLVAMTILSTGTAILRVNNLVLVTKYLKGQGIGQVQGLGASALSIARFAAPLISGILQDISFAAPSAVSIVFSLIAIAVFYNDSYIFAHSKARKD